MVLVLLPLIIGFTFILVYFLKERFGYMVPVSLILTSFLLYFSQLIFNTFSFGIYIFIIFGILGCLLLIYFMLKKASLKLFFSPGLYAFIFVFFFALIAYGNRHFSAWDECSHWGYMVKEMIRLDKFYYQPAARNMAHKDYPPMAQIFEYLVCRFSGGYSEGKASFGIQLLLLSFVVPAFSEKYAENWHDAGKSVKDQIKTLLISGILLVITILLFLSFDTFDVYKTILVDCLVSSIGAYAIILVLSRESVNKTARQLSLLAVMAYMPLCKQITLAYVLLVAFVYFTSLIIYRTDKKGVVGLDVVYMFLYVIVPIISLKTWSFAIKPYNLGAQFDLSRIDPIQVVRILIGKGSWDQHYTYLKYLSSLLDTSLTTGPIQMSYITAGLVVGVLGMVVISKKRDMVAWGLTCLAGLSGYAFTMFVMYIYGFSEGEMLGLASFTRYMGAFIVSLYLVIFYMFLGSKLSIAENNLGLFRLGVVTAIMFVFCGQERLTSFMPRVLGNEMRDFQELAAKVDATVEYDDKVLLISNNNEMYYPFLRYYCDDAIILGTDFWNGITDDDLRQFDYVFVIDSNEFLDEQWGPLFVEPVEKLVPGVYKVIDTSGTCRLG